MLGIGLKSVGINNMNNFFWFIIYGICNRLDNLKNEIKWGFQRMFRGYDDTAKWGLDTYLGDIALPVLKYLRNNKCGIALVEGFEDKSFEEQEKAWNDVLDKMIKSFQLIKDDDFDTEVHPIEWYKEHQEQIQEGLQLFARYYQNLWD